MKVAHWCGGTNASDTLVGKTDMSDTLVGKTGVSDVGVWRDSCK